MKMTAVAAAGGRLILERGREVKKKSRDITDLFTRGTAAGQTRPSHLKSQRSGFPVVEFPRTINQPTLLLSYRTAAYANSKVYTIKAE